MYLKVRLEKSGVLIADEVEIAQSFGRRLVGLLGRSGIKPNQGLFFPKCGAVHSFMMRFSIDILFLDKAQVVTKTVHCLKPNRMALSPRRTEDTLELAHGVLKDHGVAVGDRITFVRCSR